jgi:chromosome segregation ATPase
MKLFAPLLLAFTLLSCQNNKENSKNKQINEIRFAPPEIKGDVEVLDASTESEEPINPNRKLIKNGSLEFETLNLEKTTKEVKTQISKLKGYISSESETKEVQKHEKHFIVRIPSTNFDSFMDNLAESVQDFDRKEVNIEDVTDQFIDTEARLKNKKQVEEKYLQILKKGVTVTDILKIEEQIGEIRGEIESVEGRLNYLKNQVNYSTLNITFYKLKASKFNFWFRIQSALASGWNNLLGFIIGVFQYWPFAIILCGMVWAVKKYRKRKS